MTKPVTRKMAVDALLWRFQTCGAVLMMGGRPMDGVCIIVCPVCCDRIVFGQDIQFDHIHADVHGGPHEYQNLRPVHAECHKIKTKRDIQANAKVKRLRGELKPKTKKNWPSRKFGA